MACSWIWRLILVIEGDPCYGVLRALVVCGVLFCRILRFSVSLKKFWGGLRCEDRSLEGGPPWD